MTESPTPKQDEPVATETGPERLRRALRTPYSRGHAVVGLLLAVLGFAAVAQVRANDQDDNFTGARQSDLIELINTLSLATDRAEADVAELRRTRDSLQDDTEASLTALTLARERAEVLGILAGTVPAVGPGIRITVEAEPGVLGTDQLLNGLQELRDSGAEAIEIDDRIRVVAETAVVDSPEEGLTVGGVPLAAPFTVDAIGDPETLASALTFAGGFIVEVQQVGGRVEVEKSENIEVASTRDVPESRYAQPVPQE